ncbi:formyltransferase family protein [Desulfofustis glycolicus]|uniref:phosphoribosylglycinamide formyltransferase 1 n=1 Tax=Desulfofustis glycolicus DSM 9705 TaxID=1121409 RepID=A0A1M5Y385_9BACT|nr:formyltransferase family protein [Desulfofustis glycolicus]MCB2214847.1 phosphoribosylglycinamide formyltransferase [Desulfobulbaceae bacterium]SHI06268.1 phosphoribosylglycinamide formyltransferase-1 [Desulfofustis glycolicus DSM 9705]
MLDMAVLLSGSGRTLDNFHERIKAQTLAGRIRVVVANVPSALGLEKAQNYGYPAFVAQNSRETNAILADYPLDIVCLAGYLKLYEPPPTLAQRVVNIHPSLIPMYCGTGFYGDRVHRAVKSRGCTVSGCTVHFADEHYDEGPIILQKCVTLDYEDSIKEIAAKVFAAECEAFPEALNLVDRYGVDFFWKRVQR